MGPASFIMVLIGCANGQECAPVMTLPVAYQSESSCLAARGEIVAASDGLGFDRVFAECRQQSRSSKHRTSLRDKPIA